MAVFSEVKHFAYPLMHWIALLIFTSQSVQAQYTDVINSNRPGKANSTYSVGTGVYQIETGYLFQRYRDESIQSESTNNQIDLVLRMGLYREAIEIMYEGSFGQYIIPETEALGAAAIAEDSFIEEGFSGRHRIGVKYLIYDRFKDPKREKPNLYSWRANNSFRLKNLLPSIAIYAGTNYLANSSTYSNSEGQFSTRLMLATQSSLSSRTVLLTNYALDKIGTEFPEWSYLVSISQNIINPHWSLFAENQGIKSERYESMILRGGLAYLWGDNFQVDLNLGTDFANTQNTFYIGSGFSCRLDRHRDKEIKSDPVVLKSSGRLSKTERRVKRRVTKRNRKRSRN